MEKNRTLKDAELYALLSELSGAIDNIYECGTDEDKDAINNAEDALWNYLNKKGYLFENEA